MFVILFFLQPVVSYADVTSDIAVTAVVNPHPSDFQLTIDASPTTATTVNQFQNITYTITYGSHLYYASPMTISASWQEGTIQGQSSPFVDITDYTVGSATNAYNTTQPVVDTVNKKITWTIVSLPANTLNRTVQFTLTTNAAYTDSQTVTFPTIANMAVTGVSIPNQSITTTYQYNPAITPSPTPTNPPTITSIPTQETGTETITPTPSTSTGDTATPTTTQISPTVPLSTTISNISVQTLSSMNATIHVTTSAQAAILIQYGTSPQNLDQASTEITGTDQIITLPDLQPNTKYYFRVVVKTSEKTTTSELFTLQTSLGSQSATIIPTSVIFTSEKILLYEPVENTKGQLHNTVVLNRNTPYEFTFAMQDVQHIKKIQAFIRNNHVLGINTFENDTPTDNVKLIEIQPGVYRGRLQTNQIPGTYGLYIRIYDTNGNISENSIASIKVVKPFTILDQATKKPIEHTQAVFARFDGKMGTFVKITPQMLDIQNPNYSDKNGAIEVVLPQGKYIAKVTVLGYEQKEVSFTIGSGDGEEYPVIYLHKEPFNLITVGSYYWGTLSDAAVDSKQYIQDLSNSVRFFELNALVATTILVFLTLLSFSSRIHIPLHSLKEYIMHYGRIITAQKQLGDHITGRIFDENTSESLHSADVYLIDADKRKIVGHATTDLNGDFKLLKSKTREYEIEVMKDGYEPMIFHESDIQAVELGGYLLSIKKQQFGTTVLEKIKIFSIKFFSLFFETLLILSLLFEISLGYALGWEKILPFLMFSIANIFLWVIHLSHLRSARNIF